MKENFWEDKLESGYYDKLLLNGKSRNRGIQAAWHDITFNTVSKLIKEDDIEEYALSEGTKMSHLYPLKYCLLYSKFTKINKNVSLHLMDNTPIKIMYDLSHWIDEDCDPCVVNDDDESYQNNYLGFYLAPKLDQEELFENDDKN